MWSHPGGQYCLTSVTELHEEARSTFANLGRYTAENLTQRNCPVS